MTQSSEKQGYIGKFEDKTVPELKELLQRQENILKKRKFLKTLPDGGRKVYQFAEKIRTILIQRGVAVPTIDTVLCEEKSVSSTSGNYVFHEMETLIPEDKKSRSNMKSVEDNIDKSKSNVEDIDVDIQVDGLDSKTLFDSTARTVGHDGVTDRCPVVTEETELSAEMGRLTVEGDGEEEQEEPYLQWKYSASFKKIIEKSEDMHSRTLFLPYSSLKIRHVKDLPERFKCKSRQKEANNTVEQETPSKVLEGQPVYKYKEAKVIPLCEAVQLQQEQQAKQKEAQSELAARRLAEKLGIKMEAFKPEGSVSYRTNEENDESDENEQLPDDLEDLD